MQLLLWYTGGAHIHVTSQSTIDVSAHRFTFYDSHGATVYDAITHKWYRDGVEYTPNFPIAFTLDDGRTVKANESGGGVTWVVS